jgi:hypothetical protein
VPLGRLKVLQFGSSPSAALTGCLLMGSNTSAVDTFLLPSTDTAAAGAARSVLPPAALRPAATGSLAVERSGLPPRSTSLPRGVTCTLASVPYSQTGRRAFYDLQVGRRDALVRSGLDAACSLVST